MNLLVYSENEIVFSSDKRGIVPLIEAIDTLSLDKLENIITADRIVGRAAVLLNIYLGSQGVYAMLISTNAKQLLLERKIKFEYRNETDSIKMKDGVIFCPFERLVQEISDPEEAYIKIKAKLNNF